MIVLRHRCFACGHLRESVKRKRCAQCRAKGRRALPTPPAVVEREPPLGWFMREILAEAARAKRDGVTWIPASETKRTLEVVDRLVVLGYLDRFDSNAVDEDGSPIPHGYQITQRGLVRLNERTKAS